MNYLFEYWYMGVFLVITWVSLVIVGIFFVWKVFSRPGRFPRSTLLLIITILLLPLVFLSGKYGTVTCGTLKPEFACVCYAIEGRIVRGEDNKKERFSKANQLCPGHSNYKSRS